MVRLLKNIKQLYLNYKIFRYITIPLKKIYDVFRYRFESDSSYLKRNFYMHHGYKPDLKKPKTLNEKIIWLKLNERNDFQTKCADKLAVREIVKEKLSEEYLIPLVFSTKDPDDINISNLPDYPVIIKTNHNSGGNIIISDKIITDFKQVRAKLKTWLKDNYYYRSREWQYKNIDPEILVEKLLVDKDGQLPDDYKFHCFNGKMEFLQVDYDRSGNHKRNFYNEEWELLPFYWHPKVKLFPRIEKKIEKPKKLNKMIECVEKLSEDFYYSRVDLYNFKNDIYFGEITFHHGSGYELFSPVEWDEKLGKLLKLPINE